MAATESLELMMMQIRQTPLPGCYVLKVHHLPDKRGQFTKLFNRSEFTKFGLKTIFLEQYATTSHAGVLRGLHFQSPPMEYTKLACCVQGEVFDAVLDIRKESPTYCQYATFNLAGSDGEILYIPPGMAHGFCAISPEAVMVYSCSAEYSSSCDNGILWNSAGIPWPIDDPVLSERDQGFVELKFFNSPFTFEPPLREM